MMKMANKSKTPALYALDISINNALSRHYKPHLLAVPGLLNVDNKSAKQI